MVDIILLLRPQSLSPPGSSMRYVSNGHWFQRGLWLNIYSGCGILCMNNSIRTHAGWHVYTNMFIWFNMFTLSLDVWSPASNEIDKSIIMSPDKLDISITFTTIEDHLHETSELTVTSRGVSFPSRNVFLSRLRSLDKQYFRSYIKHKCVQHAYVNQGHMPLWTVVHKKECFGL